MAATPPPLRPNASAAERARHYRWKQRGGPPREPVPCGTKTYGDDGVLKGSWAPIMRHKRAGENPRDCALCAPIVRELGRLEQQKRRAQAKKG